MYNIISTTLVNLILTLFFYIGKIAIEKHDVSRLGLITLVENNVVGRVFIGSTFFFAGSVAIYWVESVIAKEISCFQNW